MASYFNAAAYEKKPTDGKADPRMDSGVIDSENLHRWVGFAIRGPHLFEGTGMRRDPARTFTEWIGDWEAENTFWLSSASASFVGAGKSMGRTYRLERSQFVDRPLAETFAFFADASNLERITPPFLNFHVEGPPGGEICAGAIIDYRLRLYGIPLKWRTEIEVFEPPRRFVDVQLRGPYRLWRHTHEFAAEGDGTRMTDCVEYQMPLGPLGAAARAVLVRRTLEKIFDYRRDHIAALLERERGGAES